MRAVLRRISWRWGLALFLLAIPLGLGWVYYFVDGPPVDDSDLALDAQPISPEENGWTVLAGKMGQLYWPEQDELGARAQTFIETRVYDGELFRQVLKMNATVLEALDSTRRFSKLRACKDAIDLHTHAIDFSGLYHVVIVRLLSFEHQGEHRRALQEAVELLRMAAKGRRSALHAVEIFEWRMTEERMVWELGRLLFLYRKLVEEVPDLGREILAGANQSESSRRIALGWYALCGKALEEGSLTEHWQDMPSIWRAPVFFLHNDTRSLLANAARAFIHDVGRPRKDHEPITSPPHRIESLNGWLGWLPVRNGIGKSAAKWRLEELDSELWRTPMLRIRRILIGTWIAVEGHRAEHGRLPASLSELVPSRLDEVPIDPYDGEPIRYSAAKRIIWSVGSDFLDAGGSTAERWQDALKHDAEPTLRIDG